MSCTGAGRSGGASGGRAEYVNYVTPGIIVLTVASAAQGTAISVAMDMTSGIIARFRTMAITRASVLTGHVLGSTIQTMLSLAVVIGVALGVGFRPTAGFVEWIAAIGMLAMVTRALTWLSVALGLVSKSVETASNSPTIVVLLPFLGSGFVPTDSMPTGLRWFADYQPFTPVIETLRGLLVGEPIGLNAAIAVGWCVGIALLGYLWARRLFNRRALGTTPNPEVVRMVLDPLTDQAGYAVDELELSVLWAGPVGETEAVLVSAALPSGAVVVLGGRGQLYADGTTRSFGDLLSLHPSGTAAQDLMLVMRCDVHEGEGPTPITSELVVLGPPGSVSFRLLGPSPAVEEPGNGRILSVQPVDGVTGVQALDAAGNMIAEEPVAGVQDISDAGDGPVN
ncbi:MAG: ABC transporter permease [Geodermatophilaceae bacterium]